jgi:site-specific DNA-cytosine methylase
MHNAIAVDVFAGGLAVGVRKHFNVLAHLEHSDYGSEVVKLNHPETPIHNHLSKWPRTPRYPGQKERTRFVCANPPCAPFSTSVPVRSRPWYEDPRVQMFQDSVGLLPDIEPDVMAIESVCPAWTKGQEFGRSLAKQAASHGYATTVLLHNAQWLGVPQHRKRLFYVFHRIAVEWDAPNFDREITVRQAWKGLKIPARTKKLRDVSLSPEYERLANHTAQGEDLADAFDRLYPDPPRNDRGQVKGRPSFLTHRIEFDRPSSVVLGDQKMIHPTEPRSPYPEELAALVGFPRDYRWPEEIKMNKIALMMSQGVSPIVGEWLASGVARSIDRGRRLNQPFLAVQDYRTPGDNYRIFDEDPETYDGPDLRYKAPDDFPWDESKVRKPSSPTPVEPRAPRGETGSGAYIRELLQAGNLSPEQIVGKVLEKFPGRKTTTKDVAWNKGRLRREGKI